MDENNRKYKLSPVAIICYVLAAGVLLYTCYMVGSLCAEIRAYYGQFGLSAPLSIYLTYSLQSLSPLFYAIVFFMLGYILDTVRKADPANYYVKEDNAFAPVAAPAAAADMAVPEMTSVEEDFARSLDAELRADEWKAAKKPEVKAEPKAEVKDEVKAEIKTEAKAEKKTENRKPRNNNRSGSGKQGGSRSNSGAKKSEGEGKSGKSGGNNQQRKSGSRKPSQSKAKAEAKAVSESEETVKIVDETENK